MHTTTGTSCSTFFCIGKEVYVEFEEVSGQVCGETHGQADYCCSLHRDSAARHSFSTSGRPQSLRSRKEVRSLRGALVWTQLTAPLDIDQHTLLRARVQAGSIQFPTVRRVRGSHYVPTGSWVSWEYLHSLNPLALKPAVSLNGVQDRQRSSYYLLLAALSRRIRTPVRTFHHHTPYRPIEIRLATSATYQQATPLRTGQPSFPSQKLRSPSDFSDNVFRPNTSLLFGSAQLFAARIPTTSFATGADTKAQGFAGKGTREGQGAATASSGTGIGRK